MSARTAFIGLDACDVHVAREFARQGDMPVLAGLLQTAAVQPTIAPLGFFVGAVWVSSWTGLSPANHRFLCSGQIRGGGYEAFWAGPVRERAVWNTVSEAGGRVAVLDAPHSTVVEPINGVFLAEWDCHDRHQPQVVSSPASFVDEVTERFGPQPVNSLRLPQQFAAPCDYKHRAGLRRTVAEEQALFADFQDGLQRKAALSVDLLGRENWDLFYSVFAESHCAGHQFWKYHDPTHREYNAEAHAALGGDPLRSIYSALDRAIGEVIAAAGPDATVYVNLSHGMQSHYDGTCLLDPVLWRLDEYASGLDELGSFSKALDVVANTMPRGARRRTLASAFDARRRLQSRAGPIGADGRPVDIPGWGARRRWWMQPNDSVHGAIRLNLEGREANPRVRRAHKAAIEGWLANRLYELVNVATGEPAIEKVHFTDDHYPRTAGDAMGDLIIDWNRSAPIDSVWSPATGVVHAPYEEWRTGDHHPEGLLLVAGPDVTPGVRPNPIPVMDIAPTLAASLDVEMTGVDGIARADLVPGRARTVRASTAIRRPLLTETQSRRPQKRRWSRDYDLSLHQWSEEFAMGLSSTLHNEHVALTETRAELVAAQARIGNLERLASIAEVGAWLKHIEVPEDLFISVITPTHNRAELLERAVESVRRQSYGNWEMLIVNDNSVDDTWARLEKLAASEPRLRPFQLEGDTGGAAARNVALDNAHGDIIVYLDDDNRFDPDWLRAVAWAFTEHPDTRFAFGARVVDDDDRHRGLASRSMPFVQFLEWDREAMLQANRIDQNVIAHRPSPARLTDIALQFSDWDLVLQLTVDTEPLAIPAIAAHYYSDAPDRLTDIARDIGGEPELIKVVQQRDRERRA
jgi:predicted AlkP superfamily phosphohydrolase/phosphomutase